MSKCVSSRTLKRFLVLALVVALGCIIASGIARADNGAKALGDKWVSQQSGAPVNLLGVSAVNTSTAWAVGWYGTIIKTTNGGQTMWDTQRCERLELIRAVSAVNTSTAWAVGFDHSSGFEHPRSLALRTTNGTTWSSAGSLGADSSWYNDVAAINANTAWVVGKQSAASANSQILKTTNGGASWTVEYTATGYMGDCMDISAIDANMVCVTTDEGYVIKNTGGPWQATAIPDFDAYDVDATAANRIWVVGSDGGSGGSIQLFNGTNWTEKRSSNSTIGSVSAANANVIFAVGGNYIYKSTNGGASWAVTQTSEWLNAVTGVDTYNAWAVGDQGDVTGVILHHECGFGGGMAAVALGIFGLLSMAGFTSFRDRLKKFLNR